MTIRRAFICLTPRTRPCVDSWSGFDTSLPAQSSQQKLPMSPTQHQLSTSCAGARTGIYSVGGWLEASTTAPRAGVGKLHVGGALRRATKSSLGCQEFLWMRESRGMGILRCVVKHSTLGRCISTLGVALSLGQAEFPHQLLSRFWCEAECLGRFENRVMRSRSTVTWAVTKSLGGVKMTNAVC